MILLLLVFAPTVVFLCIWTVVTAWRILRPEEAFALERDPFVMREVARARGEVVSVGFRELRQDQRRHERQTLTSYEYDAGDLFRQGVPLEWMDDLESRRN